MDYAKLTAQARQAAEELLQAAHLETGDIFVVGCSSSEIMGGRIGKDSSMEAAAAAAPLQSLQINHPHPTVDVLRLGGGFLID